jgi:peptide subunit release factor 1 (eRF1)
MLDSEMVGRICADAYRRGDLTQTLTIIDRVNRAEQLLADFDGARARLRIKLENELAIALAALNALPR